MQFPQFPPQTASITMPDGRQIPTFWTGPTVNLTWEGIGDAEGKDNGLSDGRFTRWDSPVFDLRANFGDQQGQGANGQELGTSPIYAPGGSLYVFINFQLPDPAAVLDFLNISAWEVAHPWNPFAMRPITTESNVTTVFTTATRPYGPTTEPDRGVSGVGIFTPPMGASGPIRFWRLRLIMRRFDLQPDPLVSLSASFY